MMIMGFGLRGRLSGKYTFVLTPRSRGGGSEGVGGGTFFDLEGCKS